MKSRRMGHVACMRDKRKACQVLAGKPEGNRTLGKPRWR
jgi:hypothetical protein